MEQKAIKLIYELCLDGYSLNQIKKILNENSVPVPE